MQVITRFNEADGTYETRPAKRAMTIRHLLTHTSGIGYAFSNIIVAKLQKNENADKQRLTLQVRKQASGPQETGFRYQVEDGIGVFYWIDDRCGYALSGQMDRGQLLAISRLVYGQLAAAESAPR